MANAYTAARAWRYGGGNQKSILKTEGTLVIDTTASGGAAVGDLPASMFGLKAIIGPAILINSTDANIYLGSPDTLGTSLMITAGDAAGAVSDLPNATYKLCIKGYA